MTEANKRDFTRVHARIAAELEPPSGGPISCRVEDVSINGVLLATQADVAMNTSCKVRLILEGTDPVVKITARGVTTREVSGLIALEFNEIDDDSYTHLRNLVLSNASDTNRVEDELDTSIGLKRQMGDF